MQARWNQLWKQVASSEPEPEFQALVAAYGESHRAYHNLGHIEDCLEQLDSAGVSPAHPIEVELSVWFHDVVYKPNSDCNEQESANWANRSLQRGNVENSSIDLICSLILATRHGEPPDCGDAQLVVDIDLSILGRTPEEFWEYEGRIRQEYRWVSWPIYRSKRVELRQGFLERPWLYSTETFRLKYEARARKNLLEAIRVLRARN